MQKSCRLVIQRSLFKLSKSFVATMLIKHKQTQMSTGCVAETKAENGIWSGSGSDSGLGTTGGFIRSDFDS